MRVTIAQVTNADTVTDSPEDVLSIKWVADGAATLAEVAERLRDYATEVEHQAAEGWQLQDPMSDGIGILIRVAQAMDEVRDAGSD